MIKSTDETRSYYKYLPITIIVFIIFTQAIHGFYATYDMDPPGAFVLLSYAILFWLIGDWFSRDSKENKIEWVHDMGFFLYLSWPVFIPFYLFKTRGLGSALSITSGFIVLYFGTHFLSFLLLNQIAP